MNLYKALKLMMIMDSLSLDTNIKTCPTCKCMFYALNNRQIYCKDESKRCSAIARDQRYKKCIFYIEEFFKQGKTIDDILIVARKEEWSMGEDKIVKHYKKLDNSKS